MSQLLASGGQSIGVVASKSALPKNEYPGLISFRMDWLDLLAVQGTLKSLLQHHSSKASILRRSAFFIVQLSHPYMTAEKTIALTSRTFVGKVMSLLLNMLSINKDLGTQQQRYRAAKKLKNIFLKKFLMKKDHLGAFQQHVWVSFEAIAT